MISSVIIHSLNVFLSICTVTSLLSRSPPIVVLQACLYSAGDGSDITIIMSEDEDVHSIISGKSFAEAGKASSCSGATDEFAKGKERSYVASLEGHCERLERKIREVRRRQQALTQDGSETAQESSITSISAGEFREKARRKEVSDIDDLVGDFGYLSVNATSRDFKGITSRTSFAQLLLTVAMGEPLPQHPSKTLPPRHEATGLLEFYFDNIFTQLPFFAETNFWTSVDAVYQEGGRFAKPFDHWIVRMVLAIASTSFSQQRGDQDQKRALSLVSAALDYSEDVLHPGSIPGIQAILLLAQYSLVDPEHFRSWYLVGCAARVMADLGLHQDLPSGAIPKDRLELRRKVFHCIYSLDRYVSTVSQRAFSFSDDSVSVPLPPITPSSIQPAASYQNHVFLRSTEPAFYLFQIRRILSSGYQEMFFNNHNPSPQPLVLTWTICAKARDWFNKAPKNAPHFFTLLYRLELLYTIVVAVSPSHRDPSICDFSKTILFDRAIDYISQVHHVIGNTGSLPFLTFIDIQRVDYVGRRLIDLLSQDYELLLSNSIPEPPPVPAGTPEPPYLAPEDRINCLGRAVRCFRYIRDILEFSVRKWNTHELLERFELDSTVVRRRLAETPAAYRAPPHTSYVTGENMPLNSSSGGYSGFGPGNMTSRRPY
ncbi:transcriptional regulator family: Fungal Specific TF [Paecilomyces variotii]|nr:transcriptional regulator family: Fungal Specific TF [Paecilomyces variotii]